MNNILKYLLQGFIVVIPATLTVIIIVKVFQFFESVFSFIGLTGSSILDTIISFAILLIFVTLVGLLASSFFFNKLFIFFETKLEHAPLIRHLYSPIKDFMNAFMGNKKKFTKPVLVLTNPIANIKEIGFITQDDLTEWNLEGVIAVYLPLSYSLSGKLIIVPKDQVTPLGIDGSDAMKFIVSGGVTDVENK